jgi:hypothetical protein
MNRPFNSVALGQKVFSKHLRSQCKKITNSMEISSSWVIIKFAATEEFPDILRNPCNYWRISQYFMESLQLLKNFPIFYGILAATEEFRDILWNPCSYWRISQYFMESLQLLKNFPIFYGNFAATETFQDFYEILAATEEFRDTLWNPCSYWRISQHFMESLQLLKNFAIFHGIRSLITL